MNLVACLTCLVSLHRFTDLKGRGVQSVLFFEFAMRSAMSGEQ